MFNKAYLNVQLALKVINDISRVLLSQKVIILKRPTCKFLLSNYTALAFKASAFI